MSVESPFTSYPMVWDCVREPPNALIFWFWMLGCLLCLPMTSDVGDERGSTTAPAGGPSVAAASGGER